MTAGTCKPGQTSAQTGCTPATHTASEKPLNQPVQDSPKKKPAPASKEAAEEQERYMESKMPALDDLVVKAVESGETFSSVPTSWDDLDEDTKGEVKWAWVNANIDSFYDSELESWSENLDDVVREDLRNDEDWHKETFRAWAEENGFTKESVKETLNKSAFRRDLGVDFDLLQWEDPAKENEETEDGQSYEEKWDDFYDHAKDAEFDSRLESAQEDEPPEYVMEQAQEQAAENFAEMGDENKFKYAEDEGKVGDDVDMPVEPPEHWHPFSDEGDEDGYAKTKAVALFIQKKRTEELLKERGLEMPDVPIDSTVWNGWKDSSTKPVSLVLQLAAAEELNGQFRFPERIGTSTMSSLTIMEKAEEATNKIFGDKSHEVLKAYARACWEASQYVLRKANVETFPAWRGVLLDKTELTDSEIVDTPNNLHYTKLPGLKLKRNGAASFTTKADVANGWTGVGTRPPNATLVVLRAQIPRTAVISLPCFGQNLANEQEVVVVGTMWNAWDAWHGRAPNDKETKFIPIKSLLGYRTKEMKEEPKPEGLEIDLLAIDWGQPNWLSKPKPEDPQPETTEPTPETPTGLGEKDPPVPPSIKSLPLSARRGR